MIAEKTWLKNGDKIVAPFTTLDCIVDNDGKAFVESAESITQNTKAVANIGDYLGIDITKKRNLFNKDTVEGNSVIKSSDGSVFRSTGFDGIYASDYIKVTPNGKYYLGTDGVGSSSYGAGFYDSNKSFVSGVAFSSTGVVGEVSVPNGCYWMRVTVKNIQSAYLVEGTEPSPYVPYVPTLREGTIVAYGGSDSTGYYVRFANGVQMCWKTVSGSLTLGAWGNIYSSQALVVGSFPVPFASKPVQSLSIVDTYSAIIPMAIGDVSTVGWSNCAVVRADGGSYYVSCNAFAIGRWK